jgi:hypothetical protein
MTTTVMLELWVDASGYQPSTNWAQVKADGVDGAIAKCNEMHIHHFQGDR